MGFNVKFVDGPVSSDLICPLCRGVLVDPMILHPCQHTVCSSCLKAFAPTTQLLSSCPICRSPLLDEPVLAPRQLVGRLLKLIVKCHRDCGFKCELNVLPNHVRHECQFSMVACPNKSKGCRQEILRKSLEEHISKCDYRVVQCEGCKNEMVYARLRMHQQRHRCLENKLLSQRVRSASAAMRQVREHRDHLRKEVVTLEGQLMRLRSSKMEVRSRLKSAPPRIRVSSDHRVPPVSSSMRNNFSISSSTSHVSDHDHDESIFMTDSSSLDPTHQSASTSSSASSRSSNPASSDQDDKVDESAVVAMLVGSASSEEIGRPRSRDRVLCKRCGKKFHPDSNNATACRWHRGPILNLFGGTCMICGQMDFKRGCIVGYHLAAEKSGS